jgi:hypothetical protein
MPALAPVVATLTTRSGSLVECRVWQRHACGLEASCQPIAARNDRDVHWQATLRDLSVKGVGLVVNRRFEKGAGLAITIPETATRPADTLLVRVVHVKALDKGQWLLGCSLVSELGEDELETLLGMARAGQAPPPAAGQHVIPGVVFRRLDGSRRVEPLRVGRLFLKGAWPLKPGTVLRIRVRDTDTDWHLVRVCDCARQDGEWSLTYTVLERPSRPAR